MVRDAEFHRKDIEGLRAIAILAVIAFHFGILPNGYLGVDVFFVISGYLITGSIFRDLSCDQFSIIDFYLRRVRRILPLTLFSTFISLLIGLGVMLPDDLENLAESVVATNLFGNNLLQAITTRNYWDPINEYKPLMHTWSLGIEEQYYIVYPVLVYLIWKPYKKQLTLILSILATVSFGLHFLPFEEHVKFYYLPFRFFELALGGTAALHLKHKVITHKYAAYLACGLVLILCLNSELLPGHLALSITTILTLGVIITDNGNSCITSSILQNRIFTSLGLISFSLYIWHQITLSYFKYFIFQQPSQPQLFLIFLLIITLSAFSYYFIERPFQNKNTFSTGALITSLGALFMATTFSAICIYWRGGVVRNIPELDIRKSDAIRGIHKKYNARIYSYDKPFNGDLATTKVLVLGNSFARDWANVLLESKFKDLIEISYIYEPLSHSELLPRATKANIIFISGANKEYTAHLGIDSSKLYVVGTKNFGKNNGYFYNHSDGNYFQQRTLMENGFLDNNEKLKQEWGSKYIDLIAAVIDTHNTVPVFTPEHMFISQDCRHFTKAGAVYFASLFENKLAKLLSTPANSESSL